MGTQEHHLNVLQSSRNETETPGAKTGLSLQSQREEFEFYMVSGRQAHEETSLYKGNTVSSEG